MDRKKYIKENTCINDLSNEEIENIEYIISNYIDNKRLFILLRLGEMNTLLNREKTKNKRNRK